ncbi:MAG: YggT family protein [Alphaproteobacteria bacterium]|nr:YggT family protein [Alphaproteobacteria bacterium]
MNLLIYVFDQLLYVYVWIVIASVILSWLVNFNVVNPYNPAIRAVQTFCYRVTEPLLAPIRRIMPDLGGLDISPIVLILGLQLFRDVVVRGFTGNLLT